MFDPKGDFCVGFFAKALEANAIHFPQGAHVLEIGSQDADWLGEMSRLRPDLTLSGLDWRDNPDPRVRKGDVLTVEIPRESFDAIVSISTIEHIGLGAYGDPSDPYGDVKTMQRCAAWLKPGGWMYLDVPCGEGRQKDGNYRRYSDADVEFRLKAPFQRESYRHIHTPDHPDAPYIALVLHV